MICTKNTYTNSSISSMEKRKKPMICKEDKEAKKIKKRKQNGEFEANNENEACNNVSVFDRHDDEPKTGYIHVKARRGQATDSHSLAERARREKIRERLQLLQSLVPDCDKVNGKAQVLDEIIKYVQSLQNLVESLAAKLASVNSMPIDFEVELDPHLNAQAPDQVQGKCCLEFPFQKVLESTSFPQFRSFADTTTSIASTVIFQDDGELFSGLDHEQFQNIDIQCLDNLYNF